MSKTMTEVLRAHWTASTHTDSKPFVDKCDGCGEVIFSWSDPTVGDGYERLAAHQAAALSAAGFGLVADAKADRGWLAKSRNTDGSVVIIGHFKTEAEAEKWAGKYPSSFVEAAS